MASPRRTARRASTTAVRDERVLRLGTRGSALALAQARLAALRLEADGWSVELVRITTGGDRAPSEPSMMLARGAFVTELEQALRERSIDLAVHSAKDMPVQESAGVTVAVYLPRGDARDAIVSRSGAGLAGLAAGARVGTESPRRRAFLLLDRPDLEVVPIRGNVDTRLAKLDRGEVDALVVAAAGLDRLGVADRIAEVLEIDRMLPAVGQGALAVQVRAGDPFVHDLSGLDDSPTRYALTAERSFLAAMGGGCRSPFAAYARSDGGRVELSGAAVDPDGRGLVRDRVVGPAAGAGELGEGLAAILLERGAGTLAESRS
ncbi:MAG: hydroxymethylbilane synthase [Gemmatimonadetes bacterium]|nr:hydroxymethylbilane synthase [Gemmatimonadota bacterium]